VSTRLTLGLGAVLLAGCVGTGPTSNEEATEILEQTLLHRQFVSYQNLRRYPGDVVCGEYQSLDPWGGNEGYQPFAVVRGTPYKGLDGTGVAVFCSKDSAAGLQTSLGLGPLDESNPELLQAYEDLKTIVAALEVFESQNGFYPSTDDGLEILTEAGKGRGAASASDGAYLDTVPEDPWGNPYRYYSEPLGGVKGRFDLWTLGADNAEGGTGANADIRHDYLKYLDHVSSLQ
jgi:type II secretion system protein G